MVKFSNWAVQSPDDAFRQVMAYRCLEDDLPEEANEYLDRAIVLDANEPVVLLSRCERAFDTQEQEHLKACLLLGPSRSLGGIS